MPWRAPAPESDPSVPDDVLDVLARAEEACGGIYTRISAEARLILGKKIELLGDRTKGRDCNQLKNGPKSDGAR